MAEMSSSGGPEFRMPPSPCTRYRPVTPGIVDRLAGIVGPGAVLWGDDEALEPYARDETPDYRLAHLPEAVVRPASAGEVAEVLRLAHAERIPVTPRGGGTGLAGGAVPVCGGIVLALERMDRLLDLDPVNMVAVLEPGVVTHTINEIAAPHGLFYAGYPMSLDECHIGGNVATNAGGAKAVKYGVTGRYVEGLDVVTASGERVSLGGRLVKNASDAMLLALLVGSEGILGVVTRVVLRLLPRPAANLEVLAFFPSVESAVQTVPRIVTQTGILPAACEFMDRRAFCLGCEYVGEPLPGAAVQAALLVTLDGTEMPEVRRQADRVADLCRHEGALEVEVAAEAARGQRLWEVRRSIGPACNERAAFQGDEDLVVPLAAIPALVAAYHALAEKYGLVVPAYGHAGDGNIHAHIFPDADWTEDRWDEVMGRLLPELYAEVARLGGKISGEHGIGLKRRPYLPMVVSEGYLRNLAAVKAALDPEGILNPGKVLPV
jgi:glycolate oxidase